MVCYVSRMTALEKAKAATAALADDEQYELFRWWVESDYFRQRQLAALKRDMAVGVEDLYNDATKHLPTPT